MTEFTRSFIDFDALEAAVQSFKDNRPFDHCIIDNFFDPSVAKQLADEFMDYEDDRWYHYSSAIEEKKATNNWNCFPALTYQVFQELIGNRLVSIIENLLSEDVFVDHGLHGGGWHIHSTGGNLNPHVDYSVHPKMRKLRKLNIIIYLSYDLLEEHGGHLGFWSHNDKQNSPAELIKEIQPKFNRAVLFDTTQNSWHGMSRELTQPRGIYRKSIAVYYLIHQKNDTDPRERALFAPRIDQISNEDVVELIKIRADTENFHKGYKGLD